MTDLRMGGAEKAQAAHLDQLDVLSRDVDHYDPLFLANRIELFRIMHRQDQPVRRSTHHDGFWMVTGYKEAGEVQRRVEDFSNKQKVVPRREVPELIPSGLGPPRHRPVKIALAKLFTPKALEALNGKLGDTATRLFEENIAKSSFDVIQDYMLPLLAEFTLVDLLGLSADRMSEYARPIHNLTRRDYPQAAVKQELAELDTKLRAIITEKRYSPESILAQITALDVEGRQFSGDDLIKIAFNLLIGGFGTTAAFTGSVFVFFARNPDLRQQIIEDVSLIPSAIDELLRLFGPVQTFARRVERDTELAGVQLREGDQLLMHYGAANLDPAAFPDPERVDLARWPNRHMSFGTGPHRCLGEQIARSALRKTLSLMVEKIPHYALIEHQVVAQSFSSSMFGYSNVPIRV